MSTVTPTPFLVSLEPGGSCDAAIAVVIIAWLTLVLPMWWAVLLLLLMRRDQVMFYQREDMRAGPYVQFPRHEPSQGTR